MSSKLIPVKLIIIDFQSVLPLEPMVQVSDFEKKEWNEIVDRMLNDKYNSQHFLQLQY